MKRATVFLFCIGAIALSPCRKVSNEFILHDPDSIVSSAETILCGKHLQLTKSEHEFRGKVLITCEGEGSVLINLKDGKQTSCHIGYVTPGMEQAFEFNIKNGQCLSAFRDPK